MTISKVALFASLISIGSVGCTRGDKSDSSDTAESAIDSEQSVSSEGDVMAANMDGANVQSLAPLTGVQLAAAVAANITAKWPNACAQVTANGANLVVTYNDCSGPRGLVHVTGTLNMALDVSTSGAIDVHATATGFEVNNATIDIDATAVYAISGTQRSLTVSSKGSGIGPFGNDVEHQGNYTLTWDPATSCGSIDGTWQTEFTVGERSNDVTLSKCLGACPTGSLTHHYIGGASLTVTFDGSATARWSASTGASGTVALDCH